MNYVLFIYENPLFNIRSNPRNVAVIIETAVFKCIPPRMAFVTATSSWPRGEGRKAGGEDASLKMLLPAPSSGFQRNFAG